MEVRDARAGIPCTRMAPLLTVELSGLRCSGMSIAGNIPVRGRVPSLTRGKLLQKTRCKYEVTRKRLHIYIPGQGLRTSGLPLQCPPLPVVPCMPNSGSLSAVSRTSAIAREQPTLKEKHSKQQVELPGGSCD